MRWRWLLVAAAALLVSAHAPRKEIGYEGEKQEPRGDYVKVEIKGTLNVALRDTDGRGKEGWPPFAIPRGSTVGAWMVTWEGAHFLGRPPGIYWVLSLDDGKLREVVRKLNGQTVVVAGGRCGFAVAGSPWRTHPCSLRPCWLPCPDFVVASRPRNRVH